MGASIAGCRICLPRLLPSCGAQRTHARAPRASALGCLTFWKAHVHQAAHLHPPPVPTPPYPWMLSLPTRLMTHARRALAAACLVRPIGRPAVLSKLLMLVAPYLKKWTYTRMPEQVRCRRCRRCAAARTHCRRSAPSGSRIWAPASWRLPGHASPGRPRYPFTRALFSCGRAGPGGPPMHSPIQPPKPASFPDIAK